MEGGLCCQYVHTMDGLIKEGIFGSKSDPVVFTALAISCFRGRRKERAVLEEEEEEGANMYQTATDTDRSSAPSRSSSSSYRCCRREKGPVGKETAARRPNGKSKCPASRWPNTSFGRGERAKIAV